MTRPTVRKPPAPQQARSRETMERLLDSAEGFLERSLFDQVSIAEIARQAGVSVGNLYNRFPDKTALLEEVYARHETKRTEWFTERLAPERWRDVPLEDRVPALLALLVTHFTARPGLIRSFIMYHRTYRDRETREMRAGAGTIYARLVEFLLERREEIRHPSPETAARTGIFVVLAACRDRLLFGADPMASAMRINQAAFRAELSLLLASYLGLPPPPDAPSRRRGGGLPAKRSPRAS
jgi:AcrR family transcriptional regulator